MKQQLADFTMYKLRYILGYSLLGVLFVGAVTIASVYTPGGLTQAEIDHLQLTNQLDSGNFAIANLPAHLLQLASLSLFGVSVFSIKLPSIILSVIAAFAIFCLLRRWFKPNVVVLSMLIMITTGQFIFIAQSATPSILYVAYSALILLFASLVIQKSKRKLLWKIALAISVGLSWYTPYFLYITLGLLLVALLHPHTRHHLLKRKELINWLIAFAVLVVTILPLTYLAVQNQNLVTSLLGIQSLSFDILDNLKVLGLTYFWISPVVIDGQILPIMDFSSITLVILGVIMLFRQSYTSRSYMIVAWLLFTLPIAVMRPHLVSVMIIPLFILLAVGTETLLSEWYKLFPKNPYARGVGLVLTSSLIGVMLISGTDRFVSGYRFTPDAVSYFNTDLSLVKEQLNERPVRTLLAVGKEEMPLYEALDRHENYDIEVTTNPKDTDTGNALVTRAALEEIPGDEWTMQRIFTNSRSKESDRLYLYKTRQDDI